jgi:hypothetical protein
MYSKKDDNENKGRKSGKGPKLSKGMKKAARQEKKAVKKQSKRAKKAVKAVAKEIGKVSRFVGSQPPIGKVAERAPIQVPVRKYNLVEKIKPIGPSPKALTAKPIKKKN